MGLFSLISFVKKVGKEEFACGILLATSGPILVNICKIYQQFQKDL